MPPEQPSTTSGSCGLKFCFSSLGCPELDIKGIFALAEKWGFRGVELRAAEGGTDLLAALRNGYRTPTQMAAQMVTARQGGAVSVASLDASLQLLKPTDAHQREVLALAHWADALGVPFLRVFDGKIPAGQSFASATNTLLRTLDWWNTARAKHGLQCELMIETHWFLAEPENVPALAARAPAPLHLLWDSMHTANASGLALAEVWQLLRPYVRHVHFKDAKPPVTGADSPAYCLPGEGVFPLEELFAILQADHFNGWVSLEWERLWHPMIPPLEDALACGRQRKWW